MATPAPLTNTAPKQASLLGLPAELRLKIYDYALGDASLKLRHRITYRGHTIRNICALLQVCRGMGLEMHPVFFSTVTFDFQDGFTEANMRAWAEAIGEQAVSELRKLHFNGKKRCAMYGAIVECDYCRRDVTLDLSLGRETLVFNSASAVAVQALDGETSRAWLALCSKGRGSCGRRTALALKNAREAVGWEGKVPQVTVESLVRLWSAVCTDNGHGAIFDVPRSR
ncbi:hypothetical protein LTR85_007552 [Meristemomyces frigidus]|nr:hypothetical protein LTR85_007552 [Meristemomyces frigidus]